MSMTNNDLNKHPVKSAAFNLPLINRFFGTSESMVRATAPVAPAKAPGAGGWASRLRGMTLAVCSLTCAFSLIGFVPKAEAGERLLLRSGTVDLVNPSQAIDLLTLPDFESGEHIEAGIIGGRPAWVGTREKRPRTKVDARTKRHFVVQMRDPISKADLINFESLKIQVVRYLPEDAVVVSGTHRQATVLAKSSNRIRAITTFRPQWKLSPELGSSSVFSGDPQIKAVVRLFPSASEAALAKKAKSEIEKALRKSKVKVLSMANRTIVLEGNRSDVATLAQVDAVEWIEPVADIELPWFNDEALRLYMMAGTGNYSDLNGYESGTKLMKFDGVWSRGLKGKGQVVAFADTGMDTGDASNIHPDFQGRVPQGFIHGLFSKSWEDPMGHGTHVGGSVGSDGSASGGKVPGGAPLADVIPQSMWSPMLNNLSVPSKLKDMFGKAHSAGAKIHTNSWGAAAGFGVYDSMAQQVDEFMHANPDFLILFAAGNNGEDADKDGRIDNGSISTPGTAKNALTVGASKNLVANGGIQAKLIELKIGKDKWGVEPLASSRLSENEKGLAPFSSRGPTQDGRLKPEVVAPGTNILSTRSRHPKADMLWGAYNQDYVWSGGTSMSTPLVAGAAAVIREYLVTDRKISEPSAALVKAALMHSSEDLFPGQFGSVGASRGQELLSVRPNQDQGFGRVDVERATTLAASLIIDEKTGLGPGDTHVYPVNVTKSTKLEATLVYTDAPGSAAASKALVNDLDIAVINSKGERFELKDRVNNHEHLMIDLAPGTYQIEVRGLNVPMGKQGYALIVSADR